MKNKILAILFSLGFLIGTFLTVIDYACFDRNFYTTFYQENATYQSMGISEDDLDKMTDVLLTYIQDKRDDLSVLISYKNQRVEGFNDREISHMVDVKELYLSAMNVRNTAFIIAFLALILLIFGIGKKAGAYLFKAFVQVLVAFLAIIGALGLYAVMDFNSFWTNFHHVFFTNDLWLLNPATDRLIMMVPGNFFYALVSKIILITIMFWILSLVLLYVWQKRSKIYD